MLIIVTEFTILLAGFAKQNILPPFSFTSAREGVPYGGTAVSKDRPYSTATLSSKGEYLGLEYLGLDRFFVVVHEQNVLDFRQNITPQHLSFYLLPHLLLFTIFSICHVICHLNNRGILQFSYGG